MTANQPPENQQPQGPGAAPQAGPAAAVPPAAAAYPGPDAPGAGYPPAGGFGQPAPSEPKKKSKLVKVLTTVGVAIAVAIVSFLVRGAFSGPAMKAGDCVQQTGDDSVKVVACDSSEAAFKVLGIIEKRSRASASLPNVCKDYPNATSVYWEGRNAGQGTLYCMQKL